MAHVTFTKHLQRFFPTLADGDVPGATVRAIVDEVERRHPGFASYVTDETGRLRRHVNVFVGEEPIRDRETLGDRVAPDAAVFILQALSGGRRGARPRRDEPPRSAEKSGKFRRALPLTASGDDASTCASAAVDLRCPRSCSRFLRRPRHARGTSL